MRWCWWCWYPLFLVLRPPLPSRAADWGHLATIGMLIQALYFGLSWIGFSLGISAGTSALIIALQPLLVAILAPHIVGEAVSRLRWVGLALGLAGAVTVILARAEIESASLLAILSTVGALLAMVTATLYEKRFGISHHPVTSNFVQYVVSFPAVLAVAWVMEPMRVEWTIELMAALAYLVVCNSLVALTLLLAMIRHGEASRVSALFYLVPPTAAVIAWVLIGEEMPPLAWAGMAIAAIGVALVGRPPPRARRS
jgi:drug/metabolite transporter (DMT)-like permease